MDYENNATSISLICYICNGTKFHLNEGFYYCNECGAQIKQLKDIDVEMEYTENVKHKEVLKIKSKTIHKEELTSWECYNYVLRGLIEEILLLGAKEEVKDVALQLWAIFLKNHQAAFFGDKQSELPKLGLRFSKNDANILYNYNITKKKKINMKNKLRDGCQRGIKKQKKILDTSNYEALSASISEWSKAITKTPNSSINSADKRTIHIGLRLMFNNTARKQYKKIMPISHLLKHEGDLQRQLKCHNLNLKTKDLKQRELSNQLKRITIYVILYVSLNLVEDNIQLSDMMRFIREGRLSSNNISHFFPQNILLTCQEVIKSVRFFTGHHLIPVSKIRKNILTFCRNINVPNLKIPNIFKLCGRFITDLCLPQDMLQFLERLIKIHPPEMRLKSCLSSLPCYEGRAMAYIVVMLKILFGIDGHMENLISDSARKINEILVNFDINMTKVFVFNDWVRYIETRKIILSHSNNSFSSQCKKDYDEENHFNYLKNEIVFDDADLLTNKRIKLSNMEKVFQKFNLEKCKNDSINIVREHVFDASFTPNFSYFRKIVASYHTLPDYMKEDHSIHKIEYFINPIKIFNIFNKNHQNLFIRRVSLKKNNQNIGVFQNLFKINKYKYATSVRIRKCDFNISKKDWYSSLKKKEQFSKIFSCQTTKKKTKNTEINKKNNKQTSVKEEYLFNSGNENSSSINKKSNNSLTFKITNFDYWLLFGRITELTKKNKIEIRNALPQKFVWLLETCSSIIGIDWDTLYKEVIIIESMLIYHLKPIENIQNIGISSEYWKSSNLLTNMYREMW